MTARPSSGAPRLAAIDVGTNSIRLVVAEVLADGTYRVLDEEREMSRLGAGVSRTGRLADDAMARSLDALG
jgi:exopolyphosphatase/guanosine-5'-triphosphate,3'-diphosphate pyrophosphatase